MKLTFEGIKDTAAWQSAGIKLPEYDVQAAAEKAKAHPVWAHFGAGNIFRIFVGGLADTLIAKGEMDRGITCVETFDFDVVDQIYAPYDNLVLAVTLNADATTDKRVLGSLSEAIKAQSGVPEAWSRLKAVFADPSLQMVSFTITEKGYALKNAAGAFFPFVQADIDNGPDKATGAMAIVCAMLLHRFENGKAPLAVVSMDNCSHNGEKLRGAVLTMADEWLKKGFVPQAFVDSISDEAQVAFPWSMIDKITPRPADSVCKELEKLGCEDIAPVITSKRTYIAPFVNAERPQYLVVEDRFPNGRPPLEKAGVYMTDRETVNKTERMKVTTCLNRAGGVWLHARLYADLRRDEGRDAGEAGQAAGLRRGSAGRRRSGHPQPEGVYRRGGRAAPAQSVHAGQPAAHCDGYLPEGGYPLWRDDQELCGEGSGSARADRAFSGDCGLAALFARRG